MSAEKSSKPKSARAAREQVPSGEQPPAAPAKIQPGNLRWQEQAAFHVTFNHMTSAGSQTLWQTHVLHEETGDERHWDGLPDSDLISWMYGRAGLSATPQDQPPAEQPPAETRSSALEPELRIVVGALEVEENPLELQVGGLAVGRHMRSRVSFDLSGPGAYLATAAIARYTIHVLACDQASAQSYLLVTSQGELNPELLTYAETLYFNLPPLGSYQLLANVVLADNDIAGTVLGPVLTVVP